MKKVYKESFTEQQIRDLITFFKTDTGQEFSEMNPEIIQKIARISQNIVMKHQAELQQKIMDSMQGQN